MKKLQVRGIALDTAAQELNTSNIALEKLRIFTRRKPNGSIDALSLVVPRKEKKSTKPARAKKKNSYRIRLKKAALNDASVVMTDQTLPRRLKTSIDHIDLVVTDFDSHNGGSLHYRYASKLNKKGHIGLRGEAKLSPLSVRGDVRLKKLAVSDFSAYLEQRTYLKLQEAFVNAKMHYRYAAAKNGFDFLLKGDMNLHDFVFVQMPQERYILQFVDLDFKGIDVRNDPKRAFVDTVIVDGLFADAQIDKDKSFNFAKLLKPQPSSKTKKRAKKAKTQKRFPFQVAHIMIKNSNALFADDSLIIPFKTEIHEIKGDVYAVSNNPDEVSYAALDGVVDRYGSMKLKGSVQSAAPKNYTDVALSFRNLELSSLSGYSAQFAGYKIAKGKLFVVLNYKIEASNMVGKNALVIKNIELGEAIEDENVTHLPLPLAIALLEDNEGMIDLTLPVEGNVDNPNFKYGKVVVKAFANLIVKAVTSPFKFLGEVLGIDAEKLAAYDFEPGRAALIPSEIEKLDQLTTVLMKRPKIKVVFTTGYNERLDRYALQKALLIQKYLQKSKAESEGRSINTLGIALLEDIYRRKKGDDALKNLSKRLRMRYKEDEKLFKLKYKDTLAEFAIRSQKVSKAMLNRLAKKRYAALSGYLIEKGIDANRIEMTKIAPLEAKDGFVEVQTKIGL